jgi:hypothetical protein
MCNLSKKTSVLGAVLPLIHMCVGDVFWTPFPGVTEPCSGHVLDVSGGGVNGHVRTCPFTPPEPRFQAVRTAWKRGPKYPELVPLNRWDCARGPGVYPGIPKPPSRRFGATWTVWRHPPQDAPKPPLARSPSPAIWVPDQGYF